MGPIADAVSYTINNTLSLERAWPHNTLPNSLRGIVIQNCGYEQHLKDYKIMLKLTKQNEQSRPTS